MSLTQKLLAKHGAKMSNKALSAATTGEHKKAPLDQSRLSIAFEFIEVVATIQVMFERQMAPQGSGEACKEAWKEIKQALRKPSGENSHFWREIHTACDAHGVDWFADGGADAKLAAVHSIRVSRGDITEDGREAPTPDMADLPQDPEPRWIDCPAPDVTDAVHEDYDEVQANRLSEVGAHFAEVADDFQSYGRLVRGVWVADSADSDPLI